MLDWARHTFGPMAPVVAENRDLPIFLPWMNGERSLEWDPALRESWHGRKEEHTPAELCRAVAEGVLFNLAQYVEVVERESGVAAETIVLSGNGFREPQQASILASLLGRDLLKPDDAGLATLRGAAVYAWRAIGHDVVPTLESEMLGAPRVNSMKDVALLDRFARFKELRATAAKFR